MAEGQDKAAAIVAALPPPDELSKGGKSGGAGPVALDAPPGDADHEAKAAALADFDAAKPGSPERTAAFEDAVYICVEKILRERGL